MSKPITFATAAIALAVAMLAYAATDASKQAQIDRAMDGNNPAVNLRSSPAASTGSFLVLPGHMGNSSYRVMSISKTRF